MKILAFTDLHASKKALAEIKKKSKDADLIVCCGDFTVFGKSAKEVLKELGTIQKDIILVHGNHEEGLDIPRGITKYKNIKYIHKKTLKVGNFEFIGYGGGGFSLVDKEFEKFAQEHEKKKNLILVTHGPPYGTALDKLNFGHCGCKSYTRFIKKAKPLMMLCGHIHENERKSEQLGKTIIINPGPHGALIAIEQEQQ